MSATLLQLITLSFSLFAIGGIGALFFSKNDRAATLWGSIFAILGSLDAFYLGARMMFQGQAVTYTKQTLFSVFAIEIHTDKLAGLFLAIIALVALLATIYGVGYMKHYFGKYNIGAFFFFYNLFLGSMLLVVLANHALFFLIAWELMALASYFLVVFDHNDRANVEAGFLYFIITHIATLAIIILFFLLYRATGSFDFDIWRNGLAHLSPLLAALIFVLTIVGFGTKAGIIPLHIWLPAAHPAAPSQVSALMSGVMIKTGIYMLIRVLFDFFGNTPQWFGLTVLLLGAISSILGVLYALGEHDIKRLLAYHSIENIGIILLGLGAALAFRSMGETTFALLALAATLFHTVNHAVFKSLLFMSAGSVVLATHTRNIEEYGGLIKRMPETALFFLIGSIAISGIVPFNGFVSEWLTFQSLFVGIHAMAVSTKAIMIVGIAALAFTGGLAAACFVKAFGITFLARPRSREAEHATEASSGMRVSMAILAFITLLLGVFGGTMAKIFMSVAASFPSLTYSFPPFILFHEELMLITGFSSLNMFMLFIALLIALLVTWILTNLTKEKQKVVVGITWDCGFPLTKRMEITATAFSRSIVTIFGSLLRPEMHVGREYVNTQKKQFTKSISVSGHLRDVYRMYAYDPAAHLTLRAGKFVSKIQSGSTHMYLAYMMLVLVALIFWATR